MKSTFIIAFLLIFFIGFIGSSGCDKEFKKQKIHTGAEQLEKYLSLIKHSRIAIVANQTSVIDNAHIVDTLISLGVKVKKIFGPEHGFRGTGDAGEIIRNNIDRKTGLPVISLHGKHKKPSPVDLEDIDLVIFDIQDVGVRFYTYISSLQYVMEACAENNLGLMILDRPNPNGFYIDGPILDTTFRSFMGLNPIPIVHGMTIGEMARMINGEGWLKNELKCKMQIIECENYNHKSRYILPIKPSPNLPTMASVYLYPSLGLFEGTTISAGRGTKHPFEIYGHPKFSSGNYSFTPASIPGASKYPKFEGEKCSGFFLGNKAALKILENPQLELKWLINSYINLNKQGIDVFNAYFPHHAGTELLKEQIIKGVPIEEICRSWEKDIVTYKETRKKYLLYDDFE